MPAARPHVVLVPFLLALWLGSLPGGAAAATTPVFGDDFWSHWGDGQAELAGYDLVYPRYGHAREGVAVAIFVTETFSESLRVKADPGRHPESDEFPVVKLNLVQDFPTGIYDYNLMTSAFVALVPVAGRPAGAPTKVSFSSQEWCGQVFAQVLFDEDGTRLDSHSYFDGEADESRVMAGPADGLSEDAILLWARGLAGPRLEPGEHVRRPMLRSLEVARLRHSGVAWEEAVLTRHEGQDRVEVPAGEFLVERVTVELPGRTWAVWVELAEPRRVVAWERSDGLRAELRAAERLKYWELNGPEGLARLEALGLVPRGAGMP